MSGSGCIGDIEEVEGTGSWAVDGGSMIRDDVVGVDSMGGMKSSSSTLDFEAELGTSKSR